MAENVDSGSRIHSRLVKFCSQPRPFEHYTAEVLWTSPHIAGQMLKYHLAGSVDLASRKTDFIDRSVEWLASRFNIGPGTNVCDFGCGPGLYAERMAQLGANVTGIDFSLNSINYARKSAESAGLAIDYIHQNYLTYSPGGPFDLIVLIFCDYCALSPAQRQTLLSVFKNALTPDGAIVLDVISKRFFDNTSEAFRVEEFKVGGFWSPQPHFVLSKTFKYNGEDLILTKHCVIEPVGDFDIYNWLQCFSVESLGGEIRAEGLQCDEHYGNVCGDPLSDASDQFALVIRRSVPA